MPRHIWGYVVCLCPIKRIPGLFELIWVGVQRNAGHGLHGNKTEGIFYSKVTLSVYLESRHSTEVLINIYEYISYML